MLMISTLLISATLAAPHPLKTCAYAKRPKLLWHNHSTSSQLGCA